MLVGILALVAVAATFASLRPEGPGITGEEAALVGAAAREATQGGEVVAIERGDDGVAWQVEVHQGGQVIEVSLAEDYRPLSLSAEPAGDTPVEDSESADAERPLTGFELERASSAALREVGGGTVAEVERSDDPGEAYELEVIEGSSETDVALDARFRPVPNLPYDD